MASSSIKPKLVQFLERIDRPLWQFYVAGIVILVLSGGLWWFKVYTAPPHVFWAMIDNSLATKSVVTEMNQTSGPNSLKQQVHTDVQTKRSRSLTTLKQNGAEVKTEIIGTHDADYTRYLSIKNPQPKDGKQHDTSKVVNVWAKSDDVAQSQTQASGNQLYAQSTLGVGLPIGTVPVPVGEIGHRERADLVQRIKNDGVYAPDYKKVKKERKNGRLLYTYEVKMQTILYVRLMQEFARQLGLHELDKVDANTYRSAKPMQVKLTVDAYSHRLTRVDSGQGVAQDYKDYGSPLAVAIPKKTIPAAELQKRLNELEKP